MRAKPFAASFPVKKRDQHLYRCYQCGSDINTSHGQMERSFEGFARHKNMLICVRALRREAELEAMWNSGNDYR